MAKAQKRSVQSAVKSGMAAKKKFEEEQRAKTLLAEETKRQFIQELRVELRKKWIESGKIFDLIETAVREGKSEVEIGSHDGACRTLASVLCEVDGLRANHHIYQARMADDCPEHNFDAVTVQWTV